MSAVNNNSSNNIYLPKIYFLFYIMGIYIKYIRIKEGGSGEKYFGKPISENSVQQILKGFQKI